MMSPTKQGAPGELDGGKRPAKDPNIRFEGDENQIRGNWSHPFDFILSCLGVAVGLGNVWRFPYLCYRNGGGAFLVPYFLSLAFAGMPLFFLEMNFGQYCSLGMLTCWRALPIMKGLSYGQFLVNFYLTISYGVVITYTFYYFFVSFTTLLPWVGCGQVWNSLMCSDIVGDCLKAGGIITTNNECIPIMNLTQPDLMDLNVTTDGLGNFSLANYTDPFKAMRKTPSEEYWIRAVIQETDTMNETGEIVWQLLICLFASYFVVFMCLIKGIKTAGKIVYFTATFPYVVLIILLIRGLMLPGSEKGISFFITPRWEFLGKPKVWLDAVVQIFYSLSVGLGGLHTLASYNKFHNNTFRDTMIVTLLNSFTSLLAGFAIFAILGYMADLQGVEVDDVVRQGFGLAFIAYPEAVARMPAAPVWSVLFFFMLITLGVDSQFVSIEKMSTGLIDEFPNIFPPHRRVWVNTGICLVLLLCSLTCITQAGPYWMSLLDNYGANFAMVLFAFLLCGGLSWLYGVRRFKNDIRTMLGNKFVDSWFFMWWPFNWAVLTPMLMGSVLIMNWISWTEPEYNGEYPLWARAIGWMIMISTLLGIPAHAIFEFIRNKGNFMERLRAITSPADSWGPALVEHRREAAEVHTLYGTTMGGVVEWNNGNVINGNTKYLSLKKEDVHEAAV